MREPCRRGHGRHEPGVPWVFGAKGARRLAEHERGGPADPLVALADRLAKLGQGDPRRLGQGLGLVGGQPRSVLDDVPGELGRQPRPERAHVQDERSQHLEDRTHPLDGVRLPADHAHERAVGGGARTTAHAAVEQRHAGGGCARGQFGDGRRGHGAHDDDRERSIRFEDAVDDLAYLGVVDHGHDHHVGEAGHLGGGGGDPGAVRERLGRLGADVADGELNPRPLQRRRHPRRCPRGRRPRWPESRRSPRTARSRRLHDPDTIPNQRLDTRPPAPARARGRLYVSPRAPHPPSDAGRRARRRRGTGARPRPGVGRGGAETDIAAGSDPGGRDRHPPEIEHVVS